MKKLAACLSVMAFLGLAAVTWAEPDAKEGATCPISKKAVSKDSFVAVNGEKTFFCCNNCVKTYLTKVIKVEDKGPQKCVISGQPAKAGTGVIHRTAKAVAFCCGNCQKGYLKKNGLAAKASRSKI